MSYSEFTDWWGFRMRMPADYRPKPLTRLELASTCLIFSLILEWLLIFAIIIFDLGKASPYLWGLFLPLSIIGLLLLPVFLLPMTFLEFDALKWLVLSRESGDIRHWDYFIAICALIFGIISVFSVGWSIKLPVLLNFLIIIAICAIFLFFQEKLDFSKRYWEMDFPDWLQLKKGKDEKDLEEEKEDVIGPDSDANPIYKIEIDNKAYDIGIHIQDELLQKLREINAEHNGFLYQKIPDGTTAVVLEDRDPVENLGNAELIRFCRQIMYRVKDHKLTRYQFANLILNFVQKEINYVRDINSTKGFPGKSPYLEYGRFPIETIHDGVGDCECTSLLCLSLLAYMGFKPALIMIKILDPDTAHTSYHAAVGLDADGVFMSGDNQLIEGLAYIEGSDKNQKKKYLYGETALDNGILAFGFVPESWKGYFTIDKIVDIPAPNYKL